MLAPHEPCPVRLACSPDGRWLAEVGARNIQIHDTRESGGPRFAVEQPAGRFHLAFSPDSSALLVASVDALTCWDLGSGATRWRIADARGFGPTAVFGDGSWVATAGADIARIYDMRDGRLVRGLQPGKSVPNPMSLTLAPDGTLLAVQGAWIYVHDVATGERQDSLPGTAPSFSADGRLLVIQAWPDVRLYDGRDPRRGWGLGDLRGFFQLVGAQGNIASTSDMALTSESALWIASGELIYAELAGRGQQGVVRFSAPDFGACVLVCAGGDRCYAGYANGAVLAWRAPQPTLPPPARSRYFESDASKKFWELTLDDTRHRLRSGAIGSAGQRTTKEFETADKAREAGDALAAKKIAEGYVERPRPARAKVQAPVQQPAESRGGLDPTPEPPAMPATRYFENREGTSNKFWELTVDGSGHRVRFGKIGSAGQGTSKQFDTASQARSAGDAIIAKKLAEGYVERAAPDPANVAAPARQRPPRCELVTGKRQAILIAGRVVNPEEGKMWRVCWRAIEGLVASWRARVPDLPLAAMIAPPEADTDGPELQGGSKVVVGVVVEVATADEGPVAVGSAEDLRAQLARAAAALDPRFWYELASVLDASIPKPREGYGDELDMWRRDNGAELTAKTVLYLTTLPFGTWGLLAFGHTVRIPDNAEASRELWRCKDAHYKPHGPAIAGTPAAHSDGHERYLIEADIGEAAHAARVATAGPLAAGGSYWLGASLSPRS